jgi:zinc ribbon protein
MTRVLQRILRRRDPDPDDEPQLESTGDEPRGQDTAAPPEADVDTGEATPGPTPSFRSRGAMRRRLRYLRRARELGFRDLGGLVFDLRRFERDRPDLVDAKIHALYDVDTELRALERVLEDRQEVTELREAGIASCPRCGALHSSDARFCSSCGLALHGPQPVSEVGDGVPAQLVPPHPQLPPAADEPHTPPPPRADQGPDEPAPFGDETTDGDETREDATQVLPPQEDADDDGSDRGRAFDG